VWSGRLFELFPASDTQAGHPSVPCLVRVTSKLKTIYGQARRAQCPPLHESLTILRLALLPYLEGDLLAFAEDMFNQARVLVGQIAVRLEVHRAWNTARRTEILREIEAGLLVAQEYDELIEILQLGMARLKIYDAYLVLYEDQFDPQGKARLALAIENGERVDVPAEQAVFAVRDLLPPGMLAGQRVCG